METKNIDLGPFLTNRFGDRYLHPVNHLVFNAVGSTARYKEYFGNRFATEKSLFVLIGSDSGLLLKHLCSAEIGAGTRVLVIELPQIINRIKEVFDVEQLPENVVLTSSDSWQGCLEKINFTAYSYLESINVLESIGADQGHLVDYKVLYRDVRQNLEDFNWRIRANLGNKTILLRQLENLAENHHPASCLKNLFQGKTAVVLGAGPSLDQALPWLIKHRDELLIIAVSRISRRLQQVGLNPHIVVTVDPEYVSFAVSREMLKFDSSVLLVHANHAFPHLVRSWTGRHLFLGKRLLWESVLEEENFELHGPTVTNTAVELAKEMGVSQIVLCGVDLCHTREGYSHSQGNTEREIGPKISELLQIVETNSGDLAESPQGYFGALTELSRQASAFKEIGGRLINMAPGAAKIPEVEFLPLEEIIFSPCEAATEVLIKAYPDDSEESQRNDLSRMKEEISRVRVRMGKIETLAREGLTCNERLFGRDGEKPDFKYKKRMDKVENTLNRDYKDLVPLVKHYGFDLFLKIVRPDDTANWTDKEIEEIGRTYYEAFIKSSGELGSELETVCLRLESRLEELAETPDIFKLVDFWENDKSIRSRLWYWVKKQGLSGVPDALPEKVKEHFAEYCAYLDRKNKKKNEAKYFDKEKIQAKAVLFFQGLDLRGLNVLLEGIEKYAELDGAKELHCLVSGYIAEIEKRWDAALDSYHRLIGEDVSPLTEEALKRVASISINLQDHENALLALECLAGISPAYQPHYAELLKLLNRREDAAQVYGDYLTKAPDDLLTMLKLGQLYAESNATEAAKMAYQYVLEADPENSAALTLLEKIGENNGSK